jgi:hypothetical protein
VRPSHSSAASHRFAAAIRRILPALLPRKCQVQRGEGSKFSLACSFSWMAVIRRGAARAQRGNQPPLADATIPRATLDMGRGTTHADARARSMPPGQNGHTTRHMRHDPWRLFRTVSPPRTPPSKLNNAFEAMNGYTAGTLCVAWSRRPDAQSGGRAARPDTQDRKAADRVGTHRS